MEGWRELYEDFIRRVFYVFSFYGVLSDFLHEYICIYLLDCIV